MSKVKSKQQNKGATVATALEAPKTQGFDVAPSGDETRLLQGCYSLLQGGATPPRIVLTHYISANYAPVAGSTLTFN